MIPYFVLDQIILGPIKIYTWGLFVGLGFSAGYLLFYYLAKKANLAPAKIVPLCGMIFAGALLGAKILAVAQLPGGIFKNINLIFSQHSGAMFMGGLVGAIICGWLYVKLTKLDFWMMADLLVLPMALGIGIGRIACILTNEHQGAITNLPWGILWPDGTLRHPVGIYEALVGFGLLAVFWWVRQKIKNVSLRAERSNLEILSLSANVQSENIVIPGLTRDPGLDSRFRGNDRGRRRSTERGILFLLFLMSYSLIRFFLEFTRVASGPLADPRWGALSVSQWMALVIFVGVVLLYIKFKYIYHER